MKDNGDRRDGRPVIRWEQAPRGRRQHAGGQRVVPKAVCRREVNDYERSKDLTTYSNKLLETRIKSKRFFLQLQLECLPRQLEWTTCGSSFC